MPGQTKEARIFVTIEALRTNRELNIRKVAKIYNMPETSLRDRMKDGKSKAESRPKTQLLDELEEKVIIQHIIDLNDWGFSPLLEGVEDMANYILTSRGK